MVMSRESYVEVLPEELASVFSPSAELKRWNEMEQDREEDILDKDKNQPGQCSISTCGFKVTEHIVWVGKEYTWHLYHFQADPYRVWKDGIRNFLEEIKEDCRGYPLSYYIEKDDDNGVFINMHLHIKCKKQHE